MINDTLLGPWVRRFSARTPGSERNLARNTQRSYRTDASADSFAAGKCRPTRGPADVVDVSADWCGSSWPIWNRRAVCDSTRNQRLAAVHALAGFVGEHSPEHIAWCAARSVPFRSKRPARQSSPIWTNRRWMRSWAPRTAKPPKAAATTLCCCFSTTPGLAPTRPLSCSLANWTWRVAQGRFVGKGGKERCCPLWPSTVGELTTLITDRPIRRACLSQSLPPSDYTLRHSHHGRTTRAQRRHSCSLAHSQTGQSPHDSTCDSRSPFACWRGHKYCSSMARSCLHRHNQHLCRNRS